MRDDKRIVAMDETKLFKQIAKEKYGKELDFEKIAMRLSHLREGAALTYADLEKIADDNCWPFSKYWMWPTREQIEEKLKKSNIRFTNLPNGEKDIIYKLDEIFKNIALVSIVLRFVCPELYGIYSRPPIKNFENRERR